MATYLNDFDAQKATFERAYNDFICVAHQLSAQQRTQAGVCGAWSPQQVVAHLVGWDKLLKTFILDSQNFDIPRDVNQFNQRSVASRDHLGWDEVMQELSTNFSDLQLALDAVEPHVQIYARVRQWLFGRLEDYELHKGQLETWLSC